MGKNLDYYLSLPYTMQIVRQDATTWFARVAELPGCITEGDSAADAAAMIQDAMASWIEIALEDGRPIPEPRPVDKFSGKFLVRLPRSLHRELVEAAEHDDVSLNQYVVAELARAVGHAQARRDLEPSRPADPAPYYTSIPYYESMQSQTNPKALAEAGPDLED